MPFGISSAPEVMQRLNTVIFSDIQGVHVYYDDIIVAGDSLSEHDQILSKVIDRARKFNVKFNKNKVQYRAEFVKYVGLLLSKSGIKPDPEHVKAIVDLEKPKNIKELQKFLGMCNYLSKFISNYSKTTEPLRDLLKKDVLWDWGSLQEKAFQEVKCKISSAPTLAILEKDGTLTLQCDSSKSGMGACLLQKGKPVSFYSRCYTECQQRWAPIEKELFAICLAMEKYHQFVYGRRIVVETDHKPLVAIMNKDINQISARLQRMVLRLLKYDFEIKYIPGSRMFVADYLSRHYNTTNGQIENTLKELVHCVSSETVYGLEGELQISKRKLIELQQESMKDGNLQHIMTWFNTEWPKNAKNIYGTELKKLFKLRNELMVKDNIVYFENRVLVPRSLRKELLSIVHSGHAGVVKCKKRARKVLFWPGMSRDIENYVLSCKPCEKYRVSNCKQPLMSHEIPDLPFSKVGMDVGHYAGKDFLVVVDYFSKWIEMVWLENKTASIIIQKLMKIFSTHGFPRYIVSDNMPFGSFDFKQFALKNDIELIMSSPHYPQSNGLSEKAVGIVKSLLKKCEESGTSFDLAMLHYRTSPVANLDYSPSELLMNRLLRTNLPCSKELLKSKLCVDVKEKLLKNNEKSRTIYNKTSKVKGSFKKGEDVIIQNVPYNKYWSSGKVMEEGNGPRSFTVMNDKGNLVRRNEKHIRKSKNKFIKKEECLWGSIPGEATRGETPVVLDDPGVSQRSVELGTAGSNDVVTRAGRVVRKPVYLEDFDLK
ncbi:uncharacterized protein K02A2.6-like isoform X2 [Amyelois transitella]|uniref:uncharacterized protein K02A2.6-like isoform X2 n=1 Tax=Amyelois transitella TaxID=680683 RepID=UPI0029902E41|nr:uncharacterized protein K02A2.6-like isoform X2 [Amyelois transitella]